MNTIHQPVLLKEAIKYLNLKPGDNVIDCTFGSGGHSFEILKRIGEKGKLLAIDADQDVVNPPINWRVNHLNIVFVNDNFANLKKIVDKNFNYHVNGILLDLGMSSDQLENSGRGFSFQKNEPLDMRFDTRQQLTAAHILNSYSLEDLYYIFKNFGEYPYARRLSKIIFRSRKIKPFLTTQDLVEAVLHLCHPEPFGNAQGRLISGSTGLTKGCRNKFGMTKVKGMTRMGRIKRIHPATKVFQALRIAVNDELENLKQVLSQAVEILQLGGRLVVISFHGLEDKIVKNYFREKSRGEGCLKLLTKKPITPIDEEVKKNPRGRSAKMRCVEKK